MSVTPAWPPCPSQKRGAHAIEHVEIDVDDEVIYLGLRCVRCGMRERSDVNAPLDDLTSDEIAALFPNGETR